MSAQSLTAALRALAGALALALLAACGTPGPTYRVPAQAVALQPAAGAPFAGAAAQPFSAQPLPPHWWRLYDDRALDALVEKALQANTDLRVAGANLARAAALQDEVQSFARPATTVSAAPGYGRISAAALGINSAAPDGPNHNAGVAVSYQLDLAGKIARALEAAGADTEAMQAAVDATRVTVAADVARAYVQTCSANEQMEVAGHSVELQQQFVALTTQLAHAGRASALELSRADAQLERLRAALPPLQAQRRVAAQRLAVLTGELPGQAVATCTRAPQLRAPIPVGDGAALLRRRPDLRRAERELAAASARIGVARAELYPEVSLGLSAGSTGPGLPLTSTNAFRWSLGPLISWTLPDTGAVQSRITQAEAGRTAALARFDASVLNALRETESALTVYARELDRHALLQAARAQSALAAQQADALYRRGRTDSLSALDARRTLAADDSALAASAELLSQDQIALFLALGGGWEDTAKAGAAMLPAPTKRP